MTDFSQILLPILRQITPSIIASEITGVQPMVDIDFSDLIWPKLEIENSEKEIQAQIEVEELEKYSEGLPSEAQGPIEL